MGEGEISLIAAGIILNKNKTKVLLIKRLDSMWGDAWSIPGGHVEYGETIKNSLLRELKEELNLEVLNAEFLVYEEFTVPTKPNKQFVSLNFIVIAKEKIAQNKEIKKAQWFNLSEISKINHKIPREGVRYIKRYIK